MDLGLLEKRSLVLASSRGLGGGVAKKLIEEGSSVLICGRTEDALKSMADELTESGPGRCFYTTVDLSQPDSAQKLYNEAVKKMGGVDILVLNGGGPPPGKISEVDSSVWMKHFESMVLRYIELSSLCLPSMRENGWGRILTLASSGVIQPIANLGISNTLRSSLIGWSKTLSNEVAADGITSNLLAPGRIHTTRVDELDEAAAKRLNKSVSEVRENSRNSIPTGRYGTVDEFASTAVFLLSKPASYITGSVIRCDGGSIQSV